MLLLTDAVLSMMYLSLDELPSYAFLQFDFNAYLKRGRRGRGKKNILYRFLINLLKV